MEVHGFELFPSVRRAMFESISHRVAQPRATVAKGRSEEHTSELQSLRHLVCRLLLEKKKQQTQKPNRLPAATCAASILGASVIRARVRAPACPARESATRRRADAATASVRRTRVAE